MNKEKIEKNLIEEVKKIATNAVNDLNDANSKKYFTQIIDKLEEECNEN